MTPTFDMDQLITHLKAQPAIQAVFGVRVAGALEFAAYQNSQTFTEATAAYVLPGSVEGADFSPRTGFYQDYTASFGVLVVLPNTKDDRKAQKPASSIPAVRAALWKALLGWNPNRDIAAYPIHIGSDAQQESDPARVHWLFTFQQAQVATQEDAYEYPSEPLEQLDAETYGSGEVEEDEEPLVRSRWRLPQ